MSYDIYRYIFIGGLVLSIVMLAATVLLFFRLNIKAAIGDITGSNKRKAIENIHHKTVTTHGNKKAVRFDYESQTTSAKLAAESVETARISPQDRYDSLDASETTALSTETVSETTVLSGVADETDAAPPIAQYEQAIGSDPEFCVEVDITYVHSNEVIR